MDQWGEKRTVCLVLFCLKNPAEHTAGYDIFPYKKMVFGEKRRKHQIDEKINLIIREKSDGRS